MRKPDIRQGLALALLFSTVVFNICDRQIINVLAQDIKTELSISDAELGLLTGTAFGIFYSVMGIPLGRLADYVNRIKLIGVVLVIWSGFTALCGLAGSYAQLFAARVGVGAGEAGSQPACISLIPDLFPEHQRTSAMSFMLMGAPVGSLVGLLAGGFVGSIWGWRTAFVVVGLPGFVLAAVMVLTLRDPRMPQRAATLTGHAPRPAPDFFAPLLRLSRRPGYIPLVAGLFCSAFLGAASAAWLPPFFIRVHAMSVAEIGGFAAIAIGIGGAAGTLGAGLICDLLRPRVREIESKMLMIALALSAPALLITVLSADRATALVSMFLFNVCAYSYVGPTAMLIQKAATADTRALAIAGAISVANILSLGLGLPLIGVLSDALTPEFAARAIGVALASCAVAGPIGTLAHWRARNALRDSGALQS